MKTNKFKNKDGSLTEYAFLCGYDMHKGVPYSENYLVLYMEHTVYHVKGNILNNSVWFTFDTLTKAKKQYNTIKL